MDFRNAVIKKKIIEFLAGKDIEEDLKKDDRTLQKTNN